MNDAQIKEALDAAVDHIFDVGQELKSRGWDRHGTRKLAGAVETFRDELLAAIRETDERDDTETPLPFEAQG